MSIIAFVGNKGGVGKTTLCVNVAAGLADGLAKRKAKVLLIDADPQQSARHWLQLGEVDARLQILDGSDKLNEIIAAQRDDYDHLLIDCPPGAKAEQTLLALRCADIAIIPIQPSPLDLWAALALEDEIDAAKDTNPELKALVLINQLEPRTKLSQLMHKATAELSIPTAESTIRRRMVFKTSGLEGGSVISTGSAGRVARDEIKQLIEEILAQ